MASSSLFDPAFYSRYYRDVADADVDPIEHYLVWGWRENRRPSPSFDGTWYLRHNPDVRQAGLNPLVHYLRFGHAQGRKPCKRTVVFTAIFGNYDDLRVPHFVDPDLDYVVFGDAWLVDVPAPWIPRQLSARFAHDRLNARYVKTHPHALLAEYEISLWADAVFQLRHVRADFVERLLDDRSIAVFAHPERDCVYEEAAAIAAWELDSPERIAAVLDTLKAHSVPPHAGLAATGMIVRRHRDERLIRAMETWWEWIHTWSWRDQLSFDFVLRQAGIDCVTIPGVFWRNDLGDWIAHRPPPWRGLQCGGAYLDREEYQAIEELVGELGIRTAIETGAGETSILFSRLGVQTISIESKAGPWLQRALSHGCQVVEVPFDEESATWSRGELRRILDHTAEADLLFIDSPIGTRRRAKILSEMLSLLPIRYVMYHDARRDLVNVVQDQQQFGLRLVRFVESPRGLALFRVDDTRRRPGPNLRPGHPMTSAGGHHGLLSLLAHGDGLELEYPTRLVAPPNWLGHTPFAFWLVGALRPRRLVELGVHTGNSYCAFLQGVQARKLETRCVGVDHWRGDAHAGFYGDEVYEELRAHHDPRYGSFSTLLRRSFDDALAEFPDGSIDLLHIDGFHTYEAVANDFGSWLPKMSARGVVLLHDTAIRERGFGIWRFWEEIAARYPGFELTHSCGLGIVYVGSEPLSGPLEVLFGAKTDDEVDGIRGYFARLGNSVLDRFSLQDVTTTVDTVEGQPAAPDAERRELGEIEARRRIAEQDAAIADRDRQILDLGHAVEERDRRLMTADHEVRRLLDEAADRARRVDVEIRMLIAAVREREQRLEVADGELRRLIGEVDQRDGRLQAADGELRRLVGEVEGRERRLREADGDLRRLLGEVGERNQRLTAADGDLRRLMGEVGERDQRLTAADGDLRRLLLAAARRDEQLAALEGRLADAERDRDRLFGEVQERGQRLAVVENRLHKIEASRLWRILSPIRHAWARLRTTISI